MKNKNISVAGVLFITSIVISMNFTTAMIPLPPPPEPDYYVNITERPSNSYTLHVLIGQTYMNLDWEAQTNSLADKYYIYIDDEFETSGDWEEDETIRFQIYTDYQDIYKQVKIKIKSTSGDYAIDYVNINFEISNYDSDNDGIPNGDEGMFGYSPYDPDSDDDGTTDFYEDYDNDDLSNYLEMQVYNTDPRNYDSDYDGLSDGNEINNVGSDPNDYYSPSWVDSDDDGLSNQMEEFESFTDPNDADTDGDGFTDGEEILGYEVAIYNDYYDTYFTNPREVDSDFDGINDWDEIAFICNDLLSFLTSDFTYEGYRYIHPSNPDSDGDGLLDGEEHSIFNTNPGKADSDGDHMEDGWELSYNLNPLDPIDGSSDQDQDGLTNEEEFMLFYHFDEPYDPTNKYSIAEAVLDDQLNGEPNNYESMLVNNQIRSLNKGVGGFSGDDGNSGLTEDGSFDADGDGILNRNDPEPWNAEDELENMNLPDEPYILNLISTISAVFQGPEATFEIRGNEIKVSYTVKGIFETNSLKLSIKFKGQFKIQGVEVTTAFKISAEFTPIGSNPTVWDVKFSVSLNFEIPLKSISVGLYSLQIGVGFIIDSSNIQTNPFQMDLPFYLYGTFQKNNGIFDKIYPTLPELGVLPYSKIKVKIKLFFSLPNNFGLYWDGLDIIYDP